MADDQPTKLPQNVKDISGQRFNRLTVISYAGMNGHNATWNCRCDCGSIVNARGGAMRSGNTRSCGCLQREFVKSKLVDLSGSIFERLTVISRAENSKRGMTRWNCRCECGALTIVASAKLYSGATKSCGCYNSELTALRNASHGMAGSPTYNSWAGAKERCFNQNNPNYVNYGGRGITMCDMWRDSFEAFYEDMGERPRNLTLERINNDGNYEPGNCKWATRLEQKHNQRPRKDSKSLAAGVH